MIYQCCLCRKILDDGRKQEGTTCDCLIIDMCPKCRAEHPEEAKRRDEALKSDG